MPSIICKNKAGISLDVMSGTDIHLIDLQGVSPVATVNTSSISGYDGSTVVSSQMPMRNIVMILRLAGEDERLKIYEVFRIKQEGTLLYQSGNRDVKIDYIVESIMCVPTTNDLKAQISLLCPQPYFESLIELTGYIAAVVPMFRFPFRPHGGFYFAKKTNSVMVTLNNPSEVDVGMRVVFYANGTVTAPSLLNVYTKERIKLDYTMQAGDTITVDTHLGKKSRILLMRNGVESNIINYMADDFTFMPLRPGDNLFKYDADSGLSALEVKIRYSEYYAGV